MAGMRPGPPADEAPNPYLAPKAFPSHEKHPSRRWSMLGIALAVPLALLGLGAIGTFAFLVVGLVMMEWEGYEILAYHDAGDLLFVLGFALLGAMGLVCFRAAHACLNHLWRRVVRMFVLAISLLIVVCYCLVLANTYSS
jgi:hypothetical protein